jgi:hypothetical protein
MMKKITWSALVICVLLVMLVPGAVQAAGGPVLLNSSAQINFPASITFNISASSDVNISDIRLHYIVNRLSFSRVVSEIYLAFASSPKVTTQWIWDMRKTGGLPPGSSVDYWWTVKDANGKTLETLPENLQIKDNRYTWSGLTRGKVTLYWYKGNNAFAADLMDAAESALQGLNASTGAEIEKPVSFYIYATSADLRGSMIFPQEWTGGVSFTEYGIIAIGIGTTGSEIAWGKRTIAHELTHLVIHQVTLNPYSGLPTWLDEGLAMVSEGILDAQFTSALSSARSKNSFISVRSLASPFSAYADQSVLAYAQSREIVKYLIDTYGQLKMFELLNTFAQGAGYDEALLKVYGFDMDGLNAKWLASYMAEAAK